MRFTSCVSVPQLPLALPVDPQQCTVQDVVADRVAEGLSVVAGGAKMNSAEDARVLYFIERAGEAGEVTNHGGHPVRRYAECRVLSEIGRQNAAGRGTDARMRRWVLGEWGRGNQRHPSGVGCGVRIAVR